METFDVGDMLRLTPLRQSAYPFHKIGRACFATGIMRDIIPKREYLLETDLSRFIDASRTVMELCGSVIDGSIVD